MDVFHHRLFHADAVGLAFRFRDPEDVIFPARASVTLPSVGGCETAHLDRGGCLELSRQVAGQPIARVTFGSARVEVMGDYKDRKAAGKLTHQREKGLQLASITSAEAEVLDLVVSTVEIPALRQRKPKPPAGHTVSAGRLFVSVTSSHEPGRDPTFCATVSLEKLAVDGQFVDVEYAPWVCKQGSDKPKESGFNVIRDSYEGDKEFFQRYGNWFYQGPNPPQQNHWPVSSGATPGLVLCSFLRPIGRECPKGVTVGDNWIQVDGFGRICLGEMLMSNYEWRLSMLRFEMGSDTGGSGDAGCTRVNGHNCPP